MFGNPWCNRGRNLYIISMRQELAFDFFSYFSKVQKAGKATKVPSVLFPCLKLFSIQLLNFVISKADHKHYDLN